MSKSQIQAEISKLQAERDASQGLEAYLALNARVNALIASLARFPRSAEAAEQDRLIAMWDKAGAFG